jgi:hypothetical protein
MKKIPSGFLNAQTDSATGLMPNGVALVSGMALATGDCRQKDGETPAASAEPLTKESVSPRHRGRLGGERKNDGLKRPSWGRGLANNPLMLPGVAGQSRRGAVTIVALVVLMILAGLIAQQVSRALSDRRHSRQQVLHLQTEKLAEAGLDLATTSYAADPAWTGLTWKIPAGSIHQTNTAEVTIQVQDGTCTVVSRYPANNEIPFQVTRTRKLTP